MDVVRTDVPLVGRDAELRTLRSSLQEDGPSGCVLVGGSGVGKSRLAACIAEHPASEGWSVLRIAATPALSEIPLGAVAHLMDPIRVPGPPDPALMLTTTQRAILERSGDDGRLLVVVDDAHWLDPATASVLLRLVEARVIVLVATVRSGEPLSEEIVALWKDADCSRVTVDPLARVDADRLLRKLLCGGPSQSLADEVWRLTQGNPLFIRELVSCSLEAEAISEREGAWTAVRCLPCGSGRISDVIRTRLGALSDDERSVLEGLAVSEPLPLVAAEQLTRPDVLARLCERAILRCTERAGQPVLEFAHPLFSEVVRQSTAEVSLRQAAGAVAEALGSVRDPDDGILLSRARLLMQAERDAPELFGMAAVAAHRLQDFEQAEAYARVALRDRDDFEIELLLADILAARGAPEAGALFTELTARYGDTPARLCQVAGTHAYAMVTDGRQAAGLALLEDSAARLAGSAPWPDVLSTQRGWLMLLGCDVRDALNVLEPVVSRADPANPLLPLALMSAAQSASILGRPQDAHRWAEESLRYLDRIPKPLPRIVQLNTACAMFSPLLACWQLGDAGGGEAFVRGAGRRLELGNSSTLHTVLAFAALFRGHLDEAARQFEALKDRLRVASPHQHAFAFTMLAWAEAQRGNPEQAASALDEVRSLPESTRRGFTWWIGRAEMLVGAASGHVPAAAKRAEELAATYREESFYAVTSLHDLVRLGIPEKALAGLEARAARPGATWWDEVCVSHARALVAGRGDDLDSCAERFESGGLDLHAVEARFQAASAHRASNQPARALLSTAAAERLLQRCGQVRTPAMADTPTMLTERETHVSRLAGGGLTNREIAEALFVSEGTVANQLTRIYAKLGLDGRTELVQLIST